MMCHGPGNEIGRTERQKTPGGRGRMTGHGKAGPFEEFSEIVRIRDEPKQTAVGNDILCVVVVVALTSTGG